MQTEETLRRIDDRETEETLRGRHDMDDTIRRLQAFEQAGADVLYAPALTTLDEVRLVTSALSKPVNVLAPMLKGVTVAQLAEAGVKRISVGGRARSSHLIVTRRNRDAGSGKLRVDLGTGARHRR
jgi:2-methylisocitrate lyase-like PEP mutase family enzyme